jgi:hypothetical protein
MVATLSDRTRAASRPKEDRDDGLGSPCEDPAPTAQPRSRHAANRTSDAIRPNGLRRAPAAPSSSSPWSRRKAWLSRFGGKATRTPVPCGPCRTRFRPRTARGVAVAVSEHRRPRGHELPRGREGAGNGLVGAASMTDLFEVVEEDEQPLVIAPCGADHRQCPLHSERRHDEEPPAVRPGAPTTIPLRYFAPRG